MTGSKKDIAILRSNVADMDRFWSKVCIDQSNCWNWLGSIGKNGHGNFWTNGETVPSHRMSFYVKNNRLPALVMHDCENPRCVNPDHLLEGSAKLNSNYPRRIEKLRAKGKLSDEEVKEIINSKDKATVIAAKFGITKGHVYVLKRGKQKGRILEGGEP